MSKFRTDFKIEESIKKIDYNSRILMIGSCFSQNISEKLKYFKFDVMSNPFGVLYNPYSIHEAFRMILGDKKLSEEDLIFNEGLWHSYMHHSSLSTHTKEELYSIVEETNQRTNALLKDADYLFITFGTSWVYQLKKNREIVANCHKVPANEFNRFRLATCDIYDEYATMIKRLQELNPELEIVFTVSPVRHFKDGAIENQLSKSILQVAVHQLVEEFENVSYFPSYEIMMDDLRDYRFYSPDMIHLGDIAIDYIFERYTVVYMDKITQMQMNEVAKIKKAVAHKPFDPRSDSYQKFVEETIKKINRLVEQFPDQDWEEEQKTLKAANM